MRGDLSSIDVWARKMKTLKDAEKLQQPTKPARRPRSLLRRLFRRAPD